MGWSVSEVVQPTVGPPNNDGCGRERGWASNSSGATGHERGGVGGARFGDVHSHPLVVVVVVVVVVAEMG